MTGQARASEERPRLRLVQDLEPWQVLSGPFYAIDLPHTGWRVALLLQQRHLDDQGCAHSAVLSTLAELAMRRVAQAQLSGHVCRLAQLGLQVLGRVRADRWLYAEAVVLSRSRGLLNSVGDVFDDDGPVAMASAVWTVRQAA